MSDQTDRKDEATADEELPPYVIEGARSGRSRCKTCRRTIDKGALRLGVLIEGPYGTGYMWHHLNCAARRMLDRVEEAYALEAWRQAKTPPASVPDLDELRKLRETAERKRKQRKTIPYAEVDPSGRARCKQCGEALAKGSVRVVLGKLVQFGSQTRVSPHMVHPSCVPDAVEEPDTATEEDGMLGALRSNSADIPSALLEAALRETGLDS